MNHIEELLVVKRSGEVVNFDSQRISNAIAAAIDASEEKYDSAKISEIVESIQDEIYDRFTEFYPNVENIQDIVEKHLLRSDMLDVARRYIIYRAERTTETKKVNEFGEFSSLFGFLYSFESIKKIEFILLFFKKFTNLEHVS